MELIPSRYEPYVQAEDLKTAVQKEISVIARRHSPGVSFMGSYDPLQMIAMRMKIAQGEAFPFDHISAFSNDKVAVVLVVKGSQVTTIEDDAGLFPSDTLITKLLLLAR